MKFRLFHAAAALSLSACTSLSAQDFQPGDHGTVTLHLKAGDLALANNAVVPAWGPLTAAGTSQPVFLLSDPLFNNKPVVRFDGVNDLMTKSAANLPARTIFAVTTSETGSVSLSGLISNGADGLNLRRNGAAAAYRSPAQAQDANDFTGNGTPAGTLIVNNSPAATFTQGVPHLLVATAGSPKNYSTFWLGNASSSLTRYWKGRVAEILIYDGTLSASGLNAVGYYLQSKYNLPTTYTSPDPVITHFSATTASGISSEGGVLSPAGGSVTLSWTTHQTTTVSIDQGVLATAPTLSGTAVVAPASTTTYTLTATNSIGTTSTKTVTIHVGATPLPPRLNEFLADNEGNLTGTDGTTPDWIEIHNPNPYGIDLHGLRLRDSNTFWDFPAGSSIPALGYRMVFASGLNRTDPAAALHTNFSLNNAGEALSLERTTTGEILSSFLPAYPPQYPDISYGWSGTPSLPGYFSVPTPGAANNSSVLGFLDRTDDTKFTVGRGFYSAAVTTTLSASTPGATLVYTTNGSEPTLTNGTTVAPANANTPPSVTLTIHPGPIPAGATGMNLASIGGVTTLRAAAFLTGYAPTNIDTQTYLFSTQVLAQTPANATAKGWPTSPVNGQLFNFGMDPAVIASFTAPEMLESLHSLPALSVVTDQNHLTHAATGIYVNADQHGSAWERPISLELIHPPGYISPDGNAAGFQINAGLRMRGGYSRNDPFFKHGFRLFFSGKYDGKLNYPLFGKEGTNAFGKLDLGTGSNYGWYRESDYSNGRFNTMVRDPFCRDTQGALGQPYTKSRYYHVYLNGHYWGLYYSEERAEAEFAASYFGGADEDYDAVKCGNHVGNFQTEATDGTLTAWQSLWTKTRAIATTGATLAKYFEILGRHPDGSRNPALPVLLDIDNLIDEMLCIFFSGDGDAVLSNFLGHDRPNNWFSVYRRSGTDGFRFFLRDSEHTLGTPAWVVDQTGPWGGSYVNDFTYSNPQRMHQDLMSSPEYKLRFADHVRKHFLDGGALTPAATLARFQARANQLEKAMKTESARWGDAQVISGLPAGHPPRYIVADWQSAINTVKTSILPGRTATVLAQLRTDGLYPTLAAPSFLTTSDQPHYGGSFSAGTTVRLKATTGVIYYTLDGRDPRLPGGAIAPGALTGTSPFDVPLAGTTTVHARAFNPTGSGWSALTSSQYLIGTLASASNTVISQIHYRPATVAGLEEYLEVMNISSSPVDLTNCTFSAGIGFSFPDKYLLPPGARILIVRNLAAFQAAYPAIPAGQIAGAFTGDTALSNNGEPLELRAADGLPIKSFTYNNKSPWPEAADGSGAGLVLINPALNPDHRNPANWRRSTTLALPGTGDAYAYPSWATANSLTDPDGSLDPDSDGLPNLIEYALGTPPGSATTPPLVPLLQPLLVDGLPGSSLTVALTRPPGRDDATLTVESSTDLTPGWLPALPVGAAIQNPDGTTTQLYRHPAPAAGPRQFLRLKAIRVP